jgi:integrase
MPMWKENWKTSHAKRTEYLIEHYVVAPFADEPIASIDRFRIQVYVNDLARRASSSVVQKFVTWTRAIFEEAVEQDFLSKNPARKLVTPKETRAPARRYLTVEEVAALLGSLDGRDRLILKMYVVLGLRARELFALRRDDVDGCRIRIDETLDYANRFHRPKTVSSAAWLWLPAGLGRDLAEWMDGMTDRQPGALLFAASNGSPIRSENWRKRVLQAAAADVGLVGVTIHALRRTCATWLNTQGKLKDVQAHLRHARPEITAEIYVQEIPESVREAVAKLELRLSEQS